MDPARLSRPALDGDARTLRPRDEGAPLSEFDRVLRFTPGGRASDLDPAARDRAAPTARDISQALDLVHEAAQTIRSADERVREGEARAHALIQRAADELKSAEARVGAAEARARAAEARVQEAEGRAKDAENWLRQIFSTISEELPQRR